MPQISSSFRHELIDRINADRGNFNLSFSGMVEMICEKYYHEKVELAPGGDRGHIATVHGELPVKAAESGLAAGEIDSQNQSNV